MSTAATEPGFEAVHFVEGFVDGVLNGTADFLGVPHHFELRSAEPGLAEVYELTPLTPQVFELVQEAWQIWRRWERAQAVDGEATLASLAHSALPEDRERQAELRGYITNWLAAAKPSAFLVEGDFRRVAANAALGIDHDLFQAKWSRLDVGHAADT